MGSKMTSQSSTTGHPTKLGIRDKTGGIRREKKKNFPPDPIIFLYLSLSLIVSLPSGDSVWLIDQFGMAGYGNFSY